MKYEPNIMSFRAMVIHTSGIIDLALRPKPIIFFSFPWNFFAATKLITYSFARLILFCHVNKSRFVTELVYYLQKSSCLFPENKPSCIFNGQNIEQFGNYPAFCIFDKCGCFCYKSNGYPVWYPIRINLFCVEWSLTFYAS